MACDRTENGNCGGCNILALLGNQAKTKEAVDLTAEGLSKRWCPETSGGIDQASRAVVYNHRPSEQERLPSSIW